MDRPWIEAGLKYGAVRQEDVPCLLVQRVARLRGRPSLTQRYLGYVIGSPGFTNYVRAIQTGTAVPHISGQQIADFRFNLPPRSEQERIASLLGIVDDKIDSNRRIATLLEEAATTMFRARFVDFVGVQEFDKSEVGRIPRDWRVGVLGDLATVAKGSIEPSSTPEVLFEHFSIPAFDKGRHADIVNGVEVLSSKTLLPGSECVLLSKLNPATKRVWLPQPTGEGRAICSPEFLVLVPRATVPNAYLYGVLSADQRFQDDLLARVSGTTGSRQRIKPADALACRVVVPDPAALAAWDRVAQPMFRQTLHLLAEERVLAAIRDALLPKLISGLVRIPFTDDPVEAIGPMAEQLAAQAG